MRNAFAVILLTLAAGRCFAATLAFPNDPRVYSVLFIGANGNVGSGIYARLSNSVYFVTAKHVLFAEQVGTNRLALLSQKALLSSFSDAGGTNISKRALQVDLGLLFAADEIRASSNRDMAMIRIEQGSTNDARVTPLSGVAFASAIQGLFAPTTNLFCNLDEIVTGSEVFMFGYPVSLTGRLGQIFDPTEPLLRKGVVAGVSPPKQTVIIDCPSYFGNSGGPVLQVEPVSLTHYRFRIIGLVQGFIPFEEEWENKTMHYSHVLKSNSGYTVVEPIGTAIAMAWK